MVATATRRKKAAVPPLEMTKKTPATNNNKAALSRGTGMTSRRRRRSCSSSSSSGSSSSSSDSSSNFSSRKATVVPGLPPFAFVPRNDENDEDENDEDDSSSFEVPYAMNFTQEEPPPRRPSRRQRRRRELGLERSVGPELPSSSSSSLRSDDDGSSSSSSTSSSNGGGYESVPDSRLPRQREGLRPGDVITYQLSAVYVAGSNKGHRRAVVLATDPTHPSFPVALDNGDCLPLSTAVRRVAEYRGGHLHRHPGRTRPLSEFRMAVRTNGGGGGGGGGGSSHFGTAIMDKARQLRETRTRLERTAVAFLTGDHPTQKRKREQPLLSPSSGGGRGGQQLCSRRVGGPEGAHGDSEASSSSSSSSSSLSLTAPPARRRRPPAVFDDRGSRSASIGGWGRPPIGRAETDTDDPPRKRGDGGATAASAATSDSDALDVLAAVASAAASTSDSAAAPPSIIVETADTKVDAALTHSEGRSGVACLRRKPSKGRHGGRKHPDATATTAVDVSPRRRHSHSNGGGGATGDDAAVDSSGPDADNDGPYTQQFGRDGPSDPPPPGWGNNRGRNVEVLAWYNLGGRPRGAADACPSPLPTCDGSSPDDDRGGGDLGATPSRPDRVEPTKRRWTAGAEDKGGRKGRSSGSSRADRDDGNAHGLRLKGNKDKSRSKVQALLSPLCSKRPPRDTRAAQPLSGQHPSKHTYGRTTATAGSDSGSTSTTTEPAAPSSLAERLPSTMQSPTKRTCKEGRRNSHQTRPKVGTEPSLGDKRSNSEGGVARRGTLSLTKHNHSGRNAGNKDLTDTPPLPRSSCHVRPAVASLRSRPAGRNLFRALPIAYDGGGGGGNGVSAWQSGPGPDRRDESARGWCGGGPPHEETLPRKVAARAPKKVVPKVRPPGDGKENVFADPMTVRRKMQHDGWVDDECDPDTAANPPSFLPTKQGGARNSRHREQTKIGPIESAPHRANQEERDGIVDDTHGCRGGCTLKSSLDPKRKRRESTSQRMPNKASGALGGGEDSSVRSSCSLGADDSHGRKRTRWLPVAARKKNATSRAAGTIDDPQTGGLTESKGISRCFDSSCSTTDEEDTERGHSPRTATSVEATPRPGRHISGLGSGTKSSPSRRGNGDGRSTRNRNSDEFFTPSEHDEEAQKRRRPRLRAFALSSSSEDEWKTVPGRTTYGMPPRTPWSTDCEVDSPPDAVARPLPQRQMPSAVQTRRPGGDDDRPSVANSTHQVTRKPSGGKAVFDFSSQDENDNAPFTPGRKRRLSPKLLKGSK